MDQTPAVVKLLRCDLSFSACIDLLVSTLTLVTVVSVLVCFFSVLNDDITDTSLTEM